MAKIEIRWSLNSIYSLEQIAEYIARDSPYYAPVFINKIIQSVDRLKDFPLSGRIVPEYEDQLIREVIFHNYRLIYRVNENIVEISEVMHSSKNIK